MSSFHHNFDLNISMNIGICLHGQKETSKYDWTTIISKWMLLESPWFLPLDQGPVDNI